MKKSAFIVWGCYMAVFLVIFVGNAIGDDIAEKFKTARGKKILRKALKEEYKRTLVGKRKGLTVNELLKYCEIVD